MSVLGIENFHPFDTRKFSKIFKYLTKNGTIRSEQLFSPYRVADKELQLIHPKKYLESLKKSKNVAAIVEIPLIRFVPYHILKHGILEPMRLGTGGTIQGAKLAMKYGWAINLSGGYHHAKPDNGDGFCFFADIPIAITILRQDRPDLRVLVVDLDAHQGNGVSSILGTDTNTAILDIYNSYIYPQDKQAILRTTYNVPIPAKTSDSVYLQLVSKWLPKAIAEHNPDIIIYNAGTDIFTLDPLGGLSITETGIIERDEFVFKTAIQNNIPILMVLSGGYHKKSGEIVAKSIENLLDNVLKKKREGRSEE